MLTLALALSAQASDHVLAVTAFATHTERADLLPLGAGIADMLITDLQQPRTVTVVERRRIDVILAELELQQTVVIDDATAVALGRGLGATAVVVGAITVMGEEMRLDARVVSVETGAALHAAHVEGAVSRFFGLERELALQLLDGLDLDDDRAVTRLEREYQPVQVTTGDDRFWSQVEHRTVSTSLPNRALRRRMLVTGAVASASGFVVVGASWAYYLTDPAVSEGGWSALKLVNTVGWVGVGAGVAVGASSLRVAAGPGGFRISVPL